MPDPGRVLVVAPNWLGDAVMALPALTDIRRRYPDARLIVAARSSVAPLFSMAEPVDEVIELEWRGRPRELGRMRRDVARLRAARAALAILLPNSFASALLVRASSVPERWGYARDARRVLLTRAVHSPSRSVHQGGYYQHLVRELGIANGPAEPSIAVPADARSQARALLTGTGWDGARPLVVHAPGAAYGSAKRWPPQHFARLAESLVRERGAHVALAGSLADAATTGAIAGMLPPDVRAHVSDLAGKTSLPVLAGLLSLGAACVSNDSGAMHLAAAAGVPLVALFGPTNEQETAPLARSGVPLEILVNPVSCRPCMLRECPIDHPCMRGLDPVRVLEVVRSIM